MSDWPPMPANVWRETDWSGYCKVCDGQCHWIGCPTGGWWAHQTHPADHHDADLGWQPEQDEDHNGYTFTVGACVFGRPDS